MRTLRNVIDISLPFVGIAVILGAMVLLRESPRLQIALVGLGMVLIELGVWKAAHRLLPNGRCYLALRVEGAQFLGLVRQLNTAALAVKEDDSPENHLAFENVRDEMRQAVERMADVAGKTDAEIAADSQISGKAGTPGRAEPSESLEGTVTVPEEPLVSENR